MQFLHSTVFIIFLLKILNFARKLISIHILIFKRPGRPKILMETQNERMKSIMKSRCSCNTGLRVEKKYTPWYIKSQRLCCQRQNCMAEFTLRFSSIALSNKMTTLAIYLLPICPMSILLDRETDSQVKGRWIY